MMPLIHVFGNLRVCLYRVHEMRDGGTFQYMGETDAFLDLDVLIYAAWQHTSFFDSGLRKKATCSNDGNN